MNEFSFDAPLEKEIEYVKKRLERLKNKHPDEVFHCPRCQKDYRSLGNYRELKLCGKCYVEVETEKQQQKTKDLIGATIQEVTVAKVSPYGSFHERVGITKLTVKLPNGKVVELIQDQPIIHL